MSHEGPEKLDEARPAGRDETAPSVVVHWHDTTRFRLQRFKLMLNLIDEVISDKGHCRIIDVGGTQQYWIALRHLWRERQVHITIANLSIEAPVDPRFETVSADARDMSFYPDGAFDVAHSNSVIEHVGHWNDKIRMAKEIRRLAPAYFVQTPAYGFPIEPHFRAPFFHWLPEPLRIKLLMRRSLGFFPKAPDVDTAMRYLESATLIDHATMQHLFPDSDLVKERVLLLTKSFIAIRHGHAAAA